MEGWRYQPMASEICPSGAKSLATKNALSILIPKASCVPKLMRWCCTFIACKRSRPPLYRLSPDLRQKRRFCFVQAMSALPPKADICGCGQDVRFVPIADIPPFIRSLRPRCGASGGCRQFAGQCYRLRQFLVFGLFVADRPEHAGRRRHLDREPGLWIEYRR